MRIHPAQRTTDLRSRNLDCIDIASRLNLSDRVQCDLAQPDASKFASPAHCCPSEHRHTGARVLDDQPIGNGSHVCRATAAVCEKCSDAILTKRLERTRARNRAAQARYRQKMKAECDEMESRVQTHAASVAAARQRLKVLKLEHTSLQRRLSVANAAKLAHLDRERSRPAPPTPAPPHSAVPPPNTTPAAASERQRASPHSKNSAIASADPPCIEKLEHMKAKNKVLSAAFAPPATSTAPSATTRTPNAWAHSAPQNSPTGSLFTAPPATPPPLATFRAHAAISFADLLEASGSHAGMIDFTGMTAVELVGQCMAEKAAQLGCGQAEIAWFAQAACEAAPGLPLAYSNTLSTPECLASCAMSIICLYLEAALISAALGLPGFTEGEIERSLAQEGPSTAAAKRACLYELPASVSNTSTAAGSSAAANGCAPCMCATRSAAAADLSYLPSFDSAQFDVAELSQCVFDACKSAGCADDDHMHVFADSGANPSADPPDVPHRLCTTHSDHGDLHTSSEGHPHPMTSSPTSSPTMPAQHGAHACVAVRCGVNQLCCSRVAARNVLQTMYNRYRGRLPRAVLEQLFMASRQQVTTTLENVLYRGPLDTSADTGRPVHSPQASGSSHSDDFSSHAYRGASAAGGAWEAGGASEAGSGRNLPEDAAAAEFQAGLAVVAVGMLQNLCRALEEVPAEARQGRGPQTQEAHGCAPARSGRPGAAAPAPDANAIVDGSFGGHGSRRQHEERIHELVASASIGCMLAQRRAPRIFWGLSASAVFPDGGFVEVEELHVKLYRHLRLSEQQKDLYAANWQLWVQRRQANDEHTASTLSHLSSLPQSLDLPLPFMRHVTSIAAGSPAPRSPQGNHNDEPGRREDAPRLIGACAADTAAAAAAVCALWTMHEADVMLLAETVDLQIQPGALLEPPQVAQAFGVHLLHGAMPIDFMAVCRLAATERRRGEAGRIPDVCFAADPPVLAISGDCAADVAPERAIAGAAYTYA